jgi:2-oxoglutarate dehydrogenase E2 component (dihydrolipoamide succinyltransferase)
MKKGASMQIEIKIPSVGESIKEAVLAEWFKKDGEIVSKDEPLFVIETDKVTLEVVAEASGRLKIAVAQGETVAIGAVVGTLDTDAVRAAAPAPENEKKPAVEKPTPAPGAPAPVAEAPKMAPAVQPPAPSHPETATEPDAPVSPSVRRLAAEKQLDLSRVPATGPGGRVTKGDVLLYMEGTSLPVAVSKTGAGALAPEAPAISAPEAVSRKPMSPIRQRIAARLVEAKQQTAMLTTFNEIDMSRAMEMRSRYKEAFEKKHGVSLGFMSFFIKATVEALKEVPEINAFIEDKDIVYHDHCHMGVAIGAERGLVVPVIRNAERKSFAQIEQAIVDLVEKIKKNRLALEDLEGGTFTISNGGVYGSLLSTPILNMPQSGILGMHKIEKRPVVIDDAVVIRPMMYVALSYDHRIVDGREAVTCLRRIKEFIENPERMMMEI